MGRPPRHGRTCRITTAASIFPSGIVRVAASRPRSCWDDLGCGREVEFPEDADTKACVDAMMDLVKSNTIRLFDIQVIRKALGGSYSGVDLTDVTPAGIGAFIAFEGARSGLIHNDDLSEAVEVMQPGTMAALIVFENTWAAPFVGAALDAGGELIASQRIPAPDVLEALDRLEATQSV